MREDVARLRPLLEELIPFHRHIGLRVALIEPGLVRLEIPFDEALLGDPLRRALHGGVIATALDAGGGSAVWTRLPRDTWSFTVDLRIDYLRPTRAEPLVVEGRTVRVGSDLGWAAMTAYHPSTPDEPAAHGTGVYKIVSRRFDVAELRP